MKTSDTQSNDKSLDLVFSALVCEYEALGETKHSHHQYVNSLMNFIIIFMSAAVVSLPTFLSQEGYMILLLLSIGFTALTMNYLRHRRLIQQCYDYERDVLQPKLNTLFVAKGYDSRVPKEMYSLWQWQTYYANQEAKGTFFSKLTKMFTRAGLPLLSALGSLGFFLLFIQYRGAKQLSSAEYVLLVIALIYGLVLFVAGLPHLRRVLTFYIRKNKNKAKESDF